ncbi:MAG: hypothetical protein AAF251_13330 [Pseudomonadota bacterium]
MTPRFTLGFAVALAALTSTAPLAAEADLSASAMATDALASAITADMAEVAVPKAETMGEPGAARDRAFAGSLAAVANQARVLNWNNEFAMLDNAQTLPGLTQAQSAKTQSFALEAIQPDFGDPETLSDEYPLAGKFTFQPRTPVRQATGAEFEQTYAFAPTTNADSRLDGDLRTVGRATNVRLRF